MYTRIFVIEIGLCGCGVQEIMWAAFYQPENRESQWYNSVWGQRPERTIGVNSGALRPKIQEIWCPREGKDGLTMWKERARTYNKGPAPRKWGEGESAEDCACMCCVATRTMHTWLSKKEHIGLERKARGWLDGRDRHSHLFLWCRRLWDNILKSKE